MHAPYHFVGDGVLDVPHRRGGDAHIVPPVSFRASAHTGVGIRLSAPPSAREVSARSADGGRAATRFLSPSRLRRQPPPGGGLTARRRRAVIARHPALRHNVPSQIRVEKIVKSAILHKFRAECWLMCRNSENCVKSLANDMQRWYTYTIHRKYTIYGHPWVSRFAAEGGKADSVFAKSNFTWEGS